MTEVDLVNAAYGDAFDEFQGLREAMGPKNGEGSKEPEMVTCSYDNMSRMVCQYSYRMQNIMGQLCGWP